VFALATIVGPPLASLLIGFGVQWALIIDALSFLVVFAALLAVRAPKAAVSVAPALRGPFLREWPSWRQPEHTPGAKQGSLWRLVQ
jgi:hypothetical protein